MLIKKWIPWWVFLSLMGFATFTVWLRLAIISTTYSITTTQTQINLLKKKKRQEENQLRQLKTPSRLSKIAEHEFHLKPAQAKQIIYINEEP
jgi:cell division protein FtsL